MVDFRDDYLDIEESEIAHFIGGELILLVTATRVESQHLHSKLQPLFGYDRLLRLYKSNSTYYIGIFGLYKIVHVQSAMGSVSSNGSIMTISDAIKLFNPKIAIMIGIAFGIDNEKQKIGDILISESVIPYDVKRVGKSRSIYRGVEGAASQLLINRFKSLSSWEHLTTIGNVSKIIFTRLLSGETLIDNVSFRNKLVKEFPYCKGGEMEGVGMHTACGNKVEWIIVKGICDFADGKKSINKSDFQNIAIESAISLTLELFNSPYVFKELGIKPLEEDEVVDHQHVSNILFDLYDSTKEPFYIVRSKDTHILANFSSYNIWIYGPPGCGKTNALLRNLILNSIPFHTINLAPYVGENVDSYFKELLYELASKVSETHQEEPEYFAQCSKAIITLLEKYYSDQKLFIFIEEIPINTDEKHKEFTEKLISLIISKNHVSSLHNVRFVLSSIESPLSHITKLYNKIHQSMLFIEFRYWDENDLDRLITMILKEIGMEIDQKFYLMLKKAAKGSPRFIKKFFRSIFSLGRNDAATLMNILDETERELKY